MLELDEGRLSCPVLRGRGSSNASLLPDYRNPKQVRTHLVETARPILEAMVQDVTRMTVLSLHHDISTVTGEELVVFTLSEPVPVRETRKR